jgi:hypothetical protein
VSDRELEEVVRIARRASDLVRAIYATPFTVEVMSEPEKEAADVC